MSVPVIAFFNNKGGVGRTSLVYHLTWMYADHGVQVLAADLDPQANLTVAFLDEDRLEAAWSDDRSELKTIYSALTPLITGQGDIDQPTAVSLDELGQFNVRKPKLLVGDLSLSRFEDELAESWSKTLGENQRAFRVMSAFWRLMQQAAKTTRSDCVLVDLGPNLGAINRAALIASDSVVVPLSPDLFSLQGLKNLGPTLREWRGQWRVRVNQNSDKSLALPSGTMQPAGYVVLQHSVRLDRPLKAYEKWIARIPEVYAEAVLDRDTEPGVTIQTDPSCLGLLTHYRSLMSMAREANKPMFFLKSADGAIGSHLAAVQGVYDDFKRLAESIADRVGIPMSTTAG